MTTSVQANQLPAATLDLLLDETDGPFPVATGVRWADAMVKLGVEHEDLFKIYGLDDSEGYECAAIARKVLVDLGLWPDKQFEKLAASRDIIVTAFLCDDMTPGDFARAAFSMASDLRQLITEEEFRAQGALAAEIQTFYEIDEVFDPTWIPGHQFPPVDWWKEIGFSSQFPRPWLLAFLQQRGMADSDGNPILASWRARPGCST